MAPCRVAALGLLLLGLAGADEIGVAVPRSRVISGTTSRGAQTHAMGSRGSPNSVWPAAFWYARNAGNGTCGAGPAPSLPSVGPLYVFPLSDEEPFLLSVGEYYCARDTAYGVDEPLPGCVQPPILTSRVSMDGGKSWSCLDTTGAAPVPTSLARYGAATFAGRFTYGSDSTWIMCVVGGASLAAPLSPNAPPDVYKTVFCSTDGRNWTQAPSLPVPVYRATVTQLSSGTVLLVGGLRPTDDSTDQFIGALDPGSGMISVWIRASVLPALGPRVQPLATAQYVTVGPYENPVLRVVVGGGVRPPLSQTDQPQAQTDLWVSYPSNSSEFVLSTSPLPGDDVRGTATAVMLGWGGPSLAGTPWAAECYIVSNPAFKCIVLLHGWSMYISTSTGTDITWKSLDQVLPSNGLPTRPPATVPTGFLLRSPVISAEISGSGLPGGQIPAIIGYSTESRRFLSILPMSCNVECPRGTIHTGCAGGPTDALCLPCKMCSSSEYEFKTCELYSGPTGVYGWNTDCAACRVCPVYLQRCNLTNNAVCAAAPPTPTPSLSPLPPTNSMASDLRAQAASTGGVGLVAILVTLAVCTAAHRAFAAALRAEGKARGSKDKRQAEADVGGRRTSVPGTSGQGLGRRAGAAASAWSALAHGWPLSSAVATLAGAAVLSATVAQPALKQRAAGLPLSGLSLELLQLGCLIWTAMIVSVAGAVMTWAHLQRSPMARVLKATLTTGRWPATSSTLLVLPASLLHARASWHVAQALASAGPGYPAGWKELHAALPGVAVFAQLLSMLLEVSCFMVAAYVASGKAFAVHGTEPVGPSGAAIMQGFAGMLAFLFGFVSLTAARGGIRALANSHKQYGATGEAVNGKDAPSSSGHAPSQEASSKLGTMTGLQGPTLDTTGTSLGLAAPLTGATVPSPTTSAADRHGLTPPAASAAAGGPQPAYASPALLTLTELVPAAQDGKEGQGAGVSPSPCLTLPATAAGQTAAHAPTPSLPIPLPFPHYDRTLSGTTEGSHLSSDPRGYRPQHSQMMHQNSGHSLTAGAGPSPVLPNPLVGVTLQPTHDGGTTVLIANPLSVVPVHLVAPMGPYPRQQQQGHGHGQAMLSTGPMGVGQGHMGVSVGMGMPWAAHAAGSGYHGGPPYVLARPDSGSGAVSPGMGMDMGPHGSVMPPTLPVLAHTRSHESLLRREVAALRAQAGLPAAGSGHGAGIGASSAAGGSESASVRILLPGIGSHGGFRGHGGPVPVLSARGSTPAPLMDSIWVCESEGEEDREGEQGTGTGAAAHRALRGRSVAGGARGCPTHAAVARPPRASSQGCGSDAGGKERERERERGRAHSHRAPSRLGLSAAGSAASRPQSAVTSALQSAGGLGSDGVLQAGHGAVGTVDASAAAAAVRTAVAMVSSAPRRPRTSPVGGGGAGGSSLVSGIAPGEPAAGAGAGHDRLDALRAALEALQVAVVQRSQRQAAGGDDGQPEGEDPGKEGERGTGRGHNRAS